MRKSGKELVLLSSLIAVEISAGLNIDELLDMIVLLGLIKNNLEAIKITKIVEKKDLKGFHNFDSNL